MVSGTQLITTRKIHHLYIHLCVEFGSKRIIRGHIFWVSRSALSAVKFRPIASRITSVHAHLQTPV